MGLTWCDFYGFCVSSDKKGNELIYMPDYVSQRVIYRRLDSVNLVSSHRVHNVVKC